MAHQKRGVNKQTQHQTSIKKSSQSLLTDAEIAYVEHKHAVDDMNARELQRRLKVEARIARGETDAVHGQLAEQHHDKACLAQQLAELKTRFDKSAKDLEQKILELKSRNTECESLRAELDASQENTTNMSKLLTEKLSLSREVANMKPELEHLRSQVETNSRLYWEKLTLQAQVRDLETELEGSKRQQKRLEKQEERHAKKYDAAQADADDMRKELDDLRKAHLQAEKERDKAIASSTQAARESNQSEVEDLHVELTHQRNEFTKLEKSQAKEVQQWEADKAVLDDKLAQFRSKLKATKEKLRETELELQVTRSAAAATSIPTSKSTDNPRKRKASQNLDSDAAIGTPGNGNANKRQKRASSVVGEKSTFSVTPFFNRTSGLQPNGADEPVASIENSSPAARPAAKVLAPAGAGKSNPKVKPSNAARKRSAAAPPTLEQVDEEEGTGNENTVPISVRSSEKDDSSVGKPAKPTLKPRKSLVNFATFREGSLQPRSWLSSVEPVTKKKRKLTGSAGGKTLMDEDEDEETVGGTTGTVGRSLFGGGGVQRAFGSFGKSAGGFGGGLLNKKKGPLQTADEFAFSPLKKERRAIAAASRAASEVPGA